ncbi:MAG: hypothetical protein QMD07_00235 [Thermodesulfovibrionales bacterium]|nr:hypothetical protein [Thermodesulfovibrionales bacterium]
MKKIFSWQVLLGIALITLSAIFYLIHYAIFRDSHHIFIYLLGDIAFVPIEVLLVTLIIHRLLNEREKRDMLKKMNMAIGVFFSEVGTSLLKYLSAFDAHPEKIGARLVVASNWPEREFSMVKKYVKNYNCRIEINGGDLEGLRDFLVGERRFLLALLQNPNLLEHESFTDLLWAVTHLTEELSHRKDLRTLPNADYEHLSGDIKRAYIMLITEWLGYMEHLKESYPYLFSLAVRTNPFDPAASPVVDS